ncbi:hypothetical protein A2V61_01115 [Candidatus Woesebacteria bacterium RBG_19FT_COMBO_47_8]|uniref:Uncharacterized protein n=1 Tax=Candidatus Woesebacteria bacterium RBG_13_46_13 TaxID=1802479 RepID=A0A1F7X4X5_9BACT|nr:MAG: hypothetical protein A2Y68_01580 [Candidatus Woesebacteria bacterium RBG_13_46_13]OGM17990.1 MAG: hypothetical protein A2V61_01115 [Candidatus Woesebacteria bacterium RBG_19FT_COMBO_47_8]HJX59274.1 hypothetical protein [Patescibacteria group bacterium]
MKGKRKFIIVGLILVIAIGFALAVWKFGYLGKVTPEETHSTPKTENNISADFPDDFPIYPGATLKSSSSTETDGKKGISALWTTADPQDKVAEFFKSNLEALGWKITNSFGGKGFSNYSFEKELVKGFIGVGVGEKGTTAISVTLGIE